MAYADIGDVQIYAPDLDEDADGDKVDVLLEQAEARIKVDFKDLDDRVTDGRAQLVLVVQAEAEMVAGVMKNPYAYQSSSDGISGLTESRTFNLAAASGLIEFTDRQRAMVANVPTSDAGGSGRAFTIRPGAAR